MAIFVRNHECVLLSGNYKAGHNITIHFREILLLGRWTEVSNNGDAAFNTCIAAYAGGAAGFSVNAANPLIVYSSAGVFTAGMVDTAELCLFAANDQNRVMARINRFIDANNVEIYAEAVPNGWITEGGPGVYIGGRILSPAAATLALNAWVLLQAPAPSNLQVRLLVSTTQQCTAYARPLGGAGTATETTGIVYNHGASAVTLRLNGVFDGPNALLYGSSSYSTAYNPILMLGTLEEAAVADTDPNFILGIADITASYMNAYPMYMLDGAGAPASIIAYPLVIKALTSAQYTGIVGSVNWRIQNGSPGRLYLHRPLVVLYNTITVGACIRGRLPMIRQANANLERWRPADASGSWVHLILGLVAPRNGVNDPLPRSQNGV